jgi:hypothetical protein
MLSLAVNEARKSCTWCVITDVDATTELPDAVPDELANELPDEAPGGKGGVGARCRNTKLTAPNPCRSWLTATSLTLLHFTAAIETLSATIVLSNQSRPKQTLNSKLTKPYPPSPIC